MAHNIITWLMPRKAEGALIKYAVVDAIGKRNAIVHITASNNPIIGCRA